MLEVLNNFLMCATSIMLSTVVLVVTISIITYGCITIAEAIQDFREK